MLGLHWKKNCSDVDPLDKTSKRRSTELLQLALFSLTFSAVVFVGGLKTH